MQTQQDAKAGGIGGAIGPATAVGASTSGTIGWSREQGYVAQRGVHQGCIAAFLKLMHSTPAIKGFRPQAVSSNCCSGTSLLPGWTLAYLSADGAGPTAEQQSQLQSLMQSLKQIEEQQKELQAAIQTAKAEKEEMLERDRDFYDPKAKDVAPPKMEVRNVGR